MLGKFKKTISVVFAVILIISSTFFYGGNAAKAAATDYSNIKVLLSTMANLKSIDITVNGTYSIKNVNNSSYAFREGVLLRKNVYTFKIVGNNIVMSSSDGEFELGSDITLYSHSAGRDNYLIMRNPSYRTCNYVGNMRIYISGGSLVFINDLNLDDYLCGVVPYEMSNAQEVESLKVQAVCARSYAYYRVAASPNATYHLNDTTGTQVYKGYNAQYTKCIAAVDQTAYQVLTYNGKYISTYYSASNGGLTEDNANAWGGTKLGYLNVNIDEYDTVYRDRKYTLSKTVISDSNATKLKNAMKSSVESKGYDFSTLTILSIDHIVPTYFAQPSSLPETDRRVYSIDIQMTVKAKKSGSDEYVTFTESVLRTRENVRTFLTCVNSSNANSGLPTTKYRIEETETEFIFSCDGNGHGIGMSQNGVYARVKAGQTYKEILAFYFMGTQIKTLQYNSYIYEPVPNSEKLDSQTSLFSTYTSPVTGIANTDAAVYQKAGAIFNITAQISADMLVTVTGESPDWYAVTFNEGTQSGFVLKKYVDLIVSELPPEWPDPPEEPDESEDPEYGIMKVGIVTQTVWARSAPEYVEGNLLKQFEPGVELIVLDKTGAFYEIYYNGISAYVSAVSVELTDIDVYSISEAKVTAYKATLFREASEMSPKIGYLSEGTIIQVFNVTYEFAGCVFNGEVSYIKSNRIDIVVDENGFMAPRNSTVIDVNLKITMLTNIYESPDADSQIVGELQQNDIVRAVVLCDEWYRIIYGDGYAYVSSEDAVIYSNNIDIEIAIADADKLIYSSADMTDVIGVMEAGDCLEVIAKNGNVLTLLYNGTLCYISSDNIRIETKEVIVEK